MAKASDLDKAALELLQAARALRRPVIQGHRPARARRRPRLDPHARLRDAVKATLTCIGPPPADPGPDPAPIGTGLVDDCIRLALRLRSGVWKQAAATDPVLADHPPDSYTGAKDPYQGFAEDELRAWGHTGGNVENLALHVLAGHAIPLLPQFINLTVEAVIESRQKAVNDLADSIRGGFELGKPEVQGLRSVGPSSASSPQSRNPGRIRRPNSNDGL